MPLYRKMLSVFTENYWLAEPETRKWYSEFCKFVELWERWLAEKIPGDVIKQLDYDDEKKLQLFYEDLEKQTDQLRNKLSGNKRDQQ